MFSSNCSCVLTCRLVSRRKGSCVLTCRLVFSEKLRLCSYNIQTCVMQGTEAVYIRAKNNVRTTVNFRANNGKDRSNDYTSGHYDRPGEYSALNRLIIYAIVRCPYGASAAIDRSIARTYVRAYIRTCVHTYVRTCIYIYIYTSSIDASTHVRT